MRLNLGESPPVRGDLGKLGIVDLPRSSEVLTFWSFSRVMSSGLPLNMKLHVSKLSFDNGFLGWNGESKSCRFLIGTGEGEVNWIKLVFGLKGKFAPNGEAKKPGAGERLSPLQNKVKGDSDGLRILP